MNCFCKIIILISGFKLGLAAPTDEIKGEDIFSNGLEAFKF